jgi:hypothetical protein
MIPGLDIILGGVTGLVGNLITGIMKYKNQKLQFDQDAKMVALETAAMKEEAKMQIAVTKAEIEGAVELADAQAYKESLKSGSKAMFSEQWIERLFNVKGRFGRFFAIPVAVVLAMGFAFVDWMRGFMRPALTLYLTGMSSVITYMAWKLINAEGMPLMTANQAVGIYNETTSIVIYLTVSCVTWWFGDRTMAKAIVNMKKEGTE